MHEAKNGSKQGLTDKVMTQIISAEKFETFYAENAELLNPPKLPEYLAELCAAKRVTLGHLFALTDIDEGFGYQISSGKRRLSRENALKLSFGLGLTVEEAQRFLMITKNSRLYPRVPRDAALIYCLVNGMGYRKTQDNLFDWGMTILGEEVKYDRAKR